MAQPRYNFTATLLNSGRVLIVGGQVMTTAEGGRTTAAVEIFDPATARFSNAASLGSARAGHVAVLMKDGRVLVAGGYTGVGIGVIGTAEIYDPVTDSWQLIAPLNSSRAQAAALRLPNGKVLVLGGGLGASSAGSQTGLVEAEIFDASAGQWSSAGEMAFGRPNYPTATLLRDGRVLVVGGRDLWRSVDERVENSEIYDPIANRWCSAQINARSGARQSHSATLLPDGRVLVAGGTQAHVAVSYADLYDPARDSWTGVPNMSEARCGQAGVSLPSGAVLVIGSNCGWPDQSASNEVFEPWANRWVPADSLSVPRGMIQAVVLPDGSIIALGGMAPPGAPSAIAEMIRPGV